MSRQHHVNVRGKFPHLLCNSGHVLYVAGFSNGAVKVGYTSQARFRVSSATTEARRAFGEISLVAVHVTQPMERQEALAAEREVLAIVRQVACSVEAYSELFTGITFERATQIADSRVGRTCEA